FADPELKTGQPVLTPLGLPRPITGGFASVYQIVCAPQRTYAVRCFLREFGDNQDRYAAISAHLATTRLPYMVNFAFLSEGILVGGRWYPILKMEWVDGESLHTYVERNLHKPLKLLDLAEQWVQMVQSLNQAGIAHGDLQHGNVLVVDDRLRLIDYDGMYVPGLAGRQSHEIGHRNYQHPARSEAYFAPSMDYFSAWIVYTSLTALANDPKLWRDFQGGDECLILRREDFDKPQTSPVLRRLTLGPDARVAALADVIRAMLDLPPDQAPPMAHVAALTAVSADWVQDHLNGAAPPSARPTPLTVARRRPSMTHAPADAVHGEPLLPAPLPAPPAWLADHVPGISLSAAPVDFAGNVLQPRLVTSASVLAVVAAWSLALGAGIGVTAPAVVTVMSLLAALGVLLGGYSRDPNVEQMWRAREGVRRTRRHLRTAHMRMRRVEQAGERIDGDRRSREERIDRKAAQLRLDEQRDLQRLSAQLQTQLAQLVQREQELRQRENAEVAAAQQRFASQIAARDTELRRLSQAETAELAETLTRRQQQFVRTFLERQLVADATIAGIGPALKQRLHEQGIRRAADIELRRLAGVQGIGDGRAQVLVEWRVQVEQQAQRAAPQRLSVLDETLIRAKFFGRRIGAERDLTRARQQQERQVSEIRQRHADRRKAQGGRKQEIHAAHQGSVEMLHKRTAHKEQKLQHERQQAQQEADARRQQVRHRQTEVEHEQDRLVAELRQYERTLAQLEHLDFGRYVRRVLNV
ncbi:MAG: hypothetical protein KAX65_16735, partial [Caldilineaceae bacterium]|nr:hypothetical protein [Caldilineaceae bacterium]